MSNFSANVSLRDKTTFRIGGPAAWYIEPVSVDAVVAAIRFARENSLPILTIGKGSNLLVSDAGWPGLVINLSGGFQSLTWSGSEVRAQSGVMLETMVRESIDRGFSGLEELSGIPGTVGGAVIMNAGAFSTCIADTLVAAEYLDCVTLLVDTLPADKLGLGYRTSALKDENAIILSARFRLDAGDMQKSRDRRAEILEKRRAKQPLDLPNCGSVFKRPPGNFAGTLIEKAGLKGYRHGNVSISSKHANFIVNHGNGTAAEVRRLIVLAQKKVFEQEGVLLEPEVIFAGTFDEPLYTPGS
jgi:UDP-N-acetylmuramate dehydrogenase